MQSNIPNLFIIGAAKAGTTTLYSILARHPQVFMSRPKATRFFIKESDYKKGLDWFTQTYFADAGAYKIRGEATPSYLAQAKKTAPRINETLPNGQTRFIVIFRNPADRAYSHYWYNRNTKTGFEKVSFERALEMEEKQGERKSYSRQFSPTRDYFKNGLYSECLKEYFRYFDRDQFLLLLFEDIFQDQFQQTTNRITDFLNIENISINYTRENQSRRVASRPTVKFVRKQRGIMELLKSLLPGRLQKSLREQYSNMISKPVKYPPMKMETREKLLERYKPGIVELQEILGRDLSHWTNGGK